jgi:NADPH-dependent ferric siderophore reductase
VSSEAVGIEKLSRERIRHEPTRRNLVVRKTADITPGIRRITLAGDALRTVGPLGPDDHVKLLFPIAGGEVVSRDFTPLSLRPEDAELDVDFVLHADPGPAALWAAKVTLGDPLPQAGPRGSRLAPAGADRAVLVADTTAFPAVRRWVSALGPAVTIELIVLAPQETLKNYFADVVEENLIITTCATDEHVLDVVRGVKIGGSTYCWAAGEATMLVPIRRHWRRDLGLSVGQVAVSGYWRRGIAGLDHHAPIDPDDPD